MLLIASIGALANALDVRARSTSNRSRAELRPSIDEFDLFMASEQNLLDPRRAVPSPGQA